MGSTKINGKPINMEKGVMPGTTLKANSSGILVEEAPKIILDDASYLAEMEKAKNLALSQRKDVIDYNESLYDSVLPEIKNSTLLGPKVLVRLFKLQMYSENLVYTGGRKMTVMSKSELDKKIVEAPPEAQFQERGVVVKAGTGCEFIKEGDIIDIDPSAFNPRAQRWFKKDIINSEFENYFLFSEYAIEFVYR